MGTCDICGRSGRLVSPTRCALCGRGFCAACGFAKLSDEEDAPGEWVGVCLQEDPEVAGAALGFQRDVEAAWARWQQEPHAAFWAKIPEFQDFLELAGVPPEKFDAGRAVSVALSVLGDSDRGHLRRGLGWETWRARVEAVAAARPPEGAQLARAVMRKLAERSEVAGRFEDAAALYEQAGDPESAGRVRRKARGIEVTSTTVDLNALIQQLKAGGLVSVYKCPSCGAPLEMSGETNIGTLTSCSHCGSTIQATDLVEFLRQVVG